MYLGAVSPGVHELGVQAVAGGHLALQMEQDDGGGVGVHECKSQVAVGKAARRLAVEVQDAQPNAAHLEG